MGCPHRCIFCDQQKTGGSFPASSEIESEIFTWLKRKQPSSTRVEVAFYGGSFTGLAASHQEQLLSVASRFIERGEVHSIRISTRPDKISVENIAILKEYGVETVEIGVQSMDSVVLERSKRGYGILEVKNAFAILKKFGFKVGAQLMPGLPGDTPTKNLRTAKKVVTLRPNFARIYPVLVIRGTPLEDLYRKKIYTPLSLESAVEWSSSMSGVLQQNGIEVIRTGLQATDLLDSGGVIVSGPYHPAFGQLVKSRLALQGLREAFRNTKNLPRGAIVIRVSPGEVSNFVGQKRENILKLKKEVKRDFVIKPSEHIKPGEFIIDGVTGMAAVNVNSFC